MVFSSGSKSTWTRVILPCCLITLTALLLAKQSTSYVHHRTTTDLNDDIMRTIQHTTKWEEMREKIYLTGIGNRQKKTSRRFPEYLHHQFNKLNKRSKRFAMVARIAENVTRIYGKRQINSVSPDPLPELCRMAGFNFTFKDCPESTRIRRFDGACNNLVHVNAGKAFAPYQRFFPPDFADGIQSIRQNVLGGPLPTARTVSLNILHFEHVFEPGYTAIISHFGQFLDHDLTSSGADSRECDDNNCNQSPFCMPIMIDQPDEFFDKPCMPFVRSLPSPGPDCQPGPRQQLNQVTSFLDASQVYGSSKTEADFLRDKTRGRGQLRSLRDPVSPTNRPLLPLDEEHKDCLFERVDRKCGLAGDHRAAEQPGLTALHTLFLRMHNSIASSLVNINPSWDDDRLFEEARRIVVASWQHIVYTEYLPTLLGRTSLISDGLRGHPTAQFFGYDVDVDPVISNVFAGAAFRFGHSQVPNNFSRVNQDYQPVFPPLLTIEAFFNASHVFDAANGGLNSLIRGMLVQQVAKVDGYISRGLTAHLFADLPGGEGLDLGALNVQRGRDHGLPSYNTWRQWCGLRRARNFNDLANEFESGAIIKFQRTYRHVEDIDLFVAGISERPMRGALVGPTLACIIGRQFQTLKFGDRFWYENAQGDQSFTADQLQEIRKVTMARVICDHANGMRTIQSLVFREPTSSPGAPGAERSFFRYNSRHQFPDIDGELPGFANVRVACSDDNIIPRLSLEPWRSSATFRRQSTDKGNSLKSEDGEVLLTVKKRSPWWYRVHGSGNETPLNLRQNLQLRERKRPKNNN
uniref:Ovoperoxidase n=1 Tax=Lytechinus variegatus TaxID=7654 RepID=O44392_LYTVA|nr:ovoperoxidase [Lytechinus variegatus]